MENEHIFSWFFGIIFLIGGLSLIFSSFFSALMMFFLAAIIIPNSREWLENRFEWLRFKTEIRIIVIILLLVAATALDLGNDSSNIFTTTKSSLEVTSVSGKSNEIVGAQQEEKKSPTKEDLIESISSGNSQGTREDMPLFIAEMETREQVSKVVWWAKTFEVVKVYTVPWSYIAKVEIKMNNETRENITIDMGLDIPNHVFFDDDPFVVGNYSASCKNDYVCQGVPWVYKMIFDLHDGYEAQYYYHFYCPNTIEACQELADKIKDYRKY